jgi:tetratricopeptide (TPR) repeat protein
LDEPALVPAVDEAIQLIKAGKAAEALVMLDSMPEQTADVFTAKGWAHQKMGNFDAAVISYDKAVSIDPERNGDRWFALGYALNLKNRVPTDDEITAYERCILLDKSHVQAHVNLGVAYIYLRKDYEKAERLFKKAIKLDSRNSSAYYNLARIYDNRLRRTYADKDFRDAKRNYERAIELGHEKARLKLAQLIAHSEQFNFSL